MAAVAYGAMKSTKIGMEQPQEELHRIRITLSSKNVKNLEKGGALSDLGSSGLLSYLLLLVSGF